MLHYPQQKAPSRYRRKAAVAFGPAQGRPCLSQVKRSKGHSFYRVRPCYVDKFSIHMDPPACHSNSVRHRFSV